MKFTLLAGHFLTFAAASAVPILEGNLATRELQSGEIILINGNKSRSFCSSKLKERDANPRWQRMLLLKPRSTSSIKRKAFFSRSLPLTRSGLTSSPSLSTRPRLKFRPVRYDALPPHLWLWIGRRDLLIGTCKCPQLFLELAPALPSGLRVAGLFPTPCLFRLVLTALG